MSTLETWKVAYGAVWAEMERICSSCIISHLYCTMRQEMEKRKAELTWEEKAHGKRASSTLFSPLLQKTAITSTVMVPDNATCRSFHPFLSWLTPTSFFRAPAGILLGSKSSNLIHIQDKHMVNLDCCDCRIEAWGQKQHSDFI